MNQEVSPNISCTQHEGKLLSAPIVRELYNLICYRYILEHVFPFIVSRLGTPILTIELLENIIYIMFNSIDLVLFVFWCFISQK